MVEQRKAGGGNSSSSSSMSQKQGLGLRSSSPLAGMERKRFEISEGSETDGEVQTFDMLLKHRARMPSLVHMPPPRTTLAAVGMLVVGSIFLVLGIVTFLTNAMGNKADDRDRGTAMIVLGSLMFIPGSYASCILYGAYRGWPGYEYSQVPSYDDD